MRVQAQHAVRCVVLQSGIDNGVAAAPLDVASHTSFARCAMHAWARTSIFGMCNYDAASLTQDAGQVR